MQQELPRRDYEQFEEMKELFEERGLSVSKISIDNSTLTFSYIHPGRFSGLEGTVCLDLESGIVEMGIIIETAMPRLNHLLWNNELFPIWFIMSASVIEEFKKKSWQKRHMTKTYPAKSKWFIGPAELRIKNSSFISDR